MAISIFLIGVATGILIVCAVLGVKKEEVKKVPVRFELPYDAARIDQSHRYSVRGRILICTVAGDMQDIGKNLVATMLKGVGFEIRDLGINVSREKFCEEVAAFRPDVLALSALLTTTMMEMKGVIKALEERQLRTGCKVVVGGAPVSAQFAQQIGADGYAPNAVEAVHLAKRLLAGAGAREKPRTSDAPQQTTACATDLKGAAEAVTIPPGTKIYA